MGIRDIQRGLGMSSPSVAYYHVNKLLKMGLIKQEESGYSANKTTFENLIRINKRALPLQAAYAAFFLTALVALLTFMRPPQLSSGFVFALAVILVAFVILALQAYKMIRTPY